MALNDNRSGFGLDLEEKFKDKIKKNLALEDIPEEPSSPVKKENKTKKTWGLTKPSIYEKVSAYAKERGRSYNDIVNELLENFIEENNL